MLIVNGNNILLNHVIISADYPLKFGYLLQVRIFVLLSYEKSVIYWK